MHLIAFDIDGTLIDSDEFDSELFVQAVQTVLAIDIDDDWSAYRHVTDGGILDEIIDNEGIKTDRLRVHSDVRATFVGLVADYLNGRGGRLREIPGARTFLAELRSRPDVAIALATGGWEETARMKLRAAGLNPDEPSFASGSDAIRRVEIMQIAEQRALRGRPASRRTYFGDGSWDQKASLELGYDFFAIGEKVEHTARYPDFRRPDLILARLGLTVL